MQFVECGSVLGLNRQNVPVVVHSWQSLPGEMSKRLVDLGILITVHLSVQQILRLIAVIIIRRLVIPFADLEAGRLYTPAVLRRIGVSEAHLDGGQPV